MSSSSGTNNNNSSSSSSSSSTSNGSPLLGGPTAPGILAVAPATMREYDDRTPFEWAVSFSAMMVPFVGFLYGHSRGVTVRAMEAIVRSPVGAPGLLALPFFTLAMEKCIYDTIQSAQGFDPKFVPADRGGFPSGGGAALPSFSFIPVQPRRHRRQQAEEQQTTHSSSSNH